MIRRNVDLSWDPVCETSFDWYLHLIAVEQAQELVPGESVLFVEIVEQDSLLPVVAVKPRSTRVDVEPLTGTEGAFIMAEGCLPAACRTN